MVVNGVSACVSLLAVQRRGRKSVGKAYRSQGRDGVENGLLETRHNANILEISKIRSIVWLGPEIAMSVAKENLACHALIFGLTWR
jgi:hypothetical protein